MTAIGTSIDGVAADRTPKSTLSIATTVVAVSVVHSARGMRGLSLLRALRA